MHERLKCARTWPAQWRPCLLLAIAGLAMPVALAQNQSVKPAEVNAALQILDTYRCHSLVGDWKGKVLLELEAVGTRAR